MAAPALTVGCLPYDTTRALFDGTVSTDGIDLTTKTAATLPELFDRTIHGDEFEVAELGLTFYLRLLETDLPYVALPVFPNRVFRHSCIFVNIHSGIREPGDLAGKTIGEFGVYGQDSGVWAKGILMDEHGFKPEESHWVIGGLEHPAPPYDFIPHPPSSRWNATTTDGPASSRSCTPSSSGGICCRPVLNSPGGSKQ